MKRTVASLALVVLGVLTFASLLNAVRASVTVGTFNAITGNPQSTFGVGEDVRIIASASATPISIAVIYNPTTTVVYTDSVNALTYDNVISGITTQVGKYTVIASSAQFTVNWRIDVVSFNVVPEAPFGTASIAMVSIGALGVYGLIRRKKTTYHI